MMDGRLPRQIELQGPVEFEAVTVNRQGEIIARKTHRAQQSVEELESGVLLELVAIPGGTFLMGSPRGTRGDSTRSSEMYVCIRQLGRGAMIQLRLCLSESRILLPSSWRIHHLLMTLRSSS